MSRAIDALIAARLIKLLVTPFERTGAYKMGIIDKKGIRKIVNELRAKGKKV